MDNNNKMHQVGKKNQRISALRTRIATLIATDEGVARKEAQRRSALISANTDVAELRSLSPNFQADQHEGYVQVLLTELEKTGDDAPSNIALTGHYGSGKSSVLAETAKRLQETGCTVVNLSLPSLGIGDGRLPRDGEKIFNTTNLIQKEIVKQLLYRRPPSEMAASRYNRLDTFNSDRAQKNSIRFGIAAVVLAIFLKLPSRVEAVLPVSAWKWLDRVLVDHVSTVVQWLIFIPLFFAVVWASTAAQRLLQQRLRITELGAGAGPAKLTLSESTASYFDEYLDEIVYFFQTSRTTVVVFEDLDRFKNPQIFETLRELNLLLNNADQTGEETIRFVYAIRDSIFEQLDGEVLEPKPEEEEDTSDSTKAAAALSDAEARRLVTTNRTKFFDLVVPIVPFVSHRTSRNLMWNELQSVPANHLPSQEVVDIVGSYITDMRLIKNICNEYDMFRTRILREGGLQGLLPDKLFASIVYKNLYLSDYEKLRNGDSLLDDVYRAFRAWVAQRAAALRRIEQSKHLQLRRLDAVAQRSERLGGRLQDVLSARQNTRLFTERIIVITNNTNYEWDDLKTPSFWRAFLDAKGDLTVNYDKQSYSRTDSLSFGKIEILVGESLQASDWADRDRAQLLEEAADAAAQQLIYAHASLRRAMNATGDEFIFEGKEQTLLDYATKIFYKADIVVDLLRTGFLDENFTLYVTQFPGDSSTSVINFVLKAVQPNVMDIDYHFGFEDAPNNDDIRALLDSEGNRLFKGKSIYNREIFDYLFANDSARLSEPIRRLANEDQDSLLFIDAYIASGAYASKFISELSRSWSKVFEHIVGDDSESVDRNLLDAALRGANPNFGYNLSEQQREIIDSLLGTLDLSTNHLPSSEAKTVAAVLKKLGIYVTALEQVSNPLRTQLISVSVIALNQGNLQTVVGDGNPISLDELQVEDRRPIYELVMSRLPEYLAIVDKTSTAASVTDSRAFPSILEEVGGRDAALITAVAERAANDCVVHDIADLSAQFWPFVVAADRLTLSASNVAAYLDEHQLDDSMTAQLEAHQRIEVDGDDSERVALAVRLLNSEKLASVTRMRLVKSLSLAEGAIVANSLSDVGKNLIPDLLQSGLVTDDRSAYEVVSSGDDDTLKQRVMNSSKNFASYMLEIDLSAQELNIITWSGTKESLRIVVADNFESLGPSFAQHGSGRFATWAAESGYQLSLDAIEMLAAKAVSRDATAFVKLLEVHAATGDIATICRILNLLGGSYSKIVVHGRERPTVPVIPGIKPILERLKSEGIVSKYDKEFLRNEYRVSKHHG